MAKARFLLHDRDTKFSAAFAAVFRAAGIEPLKLPPQSPNLNAFAERWVRTVKEESLDQLILFGERSLRHALQEYLAHHQHERNHQGLANVIPFPDARTGCRPGRFTKLSGWADCSTSIIAPPDRLALRVYVSIRRVRAIRAVCVHHLTPLAFSHLPLDHSNRYPLPSVDSCS